VYASVAGTSHAAIGVPCQDAGIVAPVLSPGAGEVLVLVTADGAGSATFSDVGARLACEAFIEVATHYILDGGDIENIRRPLGEDWVWTIAERVRLQALVIPCEPRELACTLAAAVVAPEIAVFFQIGDGAIVIDDHGGYRPVFWPQSGEYVNTTFFLTDDQAVDRVQFCALPAEVNEIALLSDGLQMLALHYESRTAFAPFFRPMFANLRAQATGESPDLTVALREFLDSMPVNSRTDDDKTLVLASRR